MAQVLKGQCGLGLQQTAELPPSGRQSSSAAPGPRGGHLPPQVWASPCVVFSVVEPFRTRASRAPWVGKGKYKVRCVLGLTRLRLLWVWIRPGVFTSSYAVGSASGNLRQSAASDFFLLGGLGVFSARRCSQHGFGTSRNRKDFSKVGRLDLQSHQV